MGKHTLHTLSRAYQKGISGQTIRIGKMSEFKHGICGCCDNKNLCLLGCCLPCYAIGKTAESADQNCLLFGLLALTPFNLCVGTYVRGLLREKYQIEGNVATDFLAHCCCSCCAIIQEAQEVTDRGDAPDGAMCM